jgi:hypothetical protein
MMARTLRRKRIFIATLGAVAIALLALAGCGAPDGPDVATAGGDRPAASPTPTAPSGDREEQIRQFAGCMREHGVDMPDPEPGPGGGLGAVAGSGVFNDPDFQTAFAACRSKLPNGGEPPKLNPDQLDRYRQFAACMRDNGVDVPDPDPDGTLRLGNGGRFGNVNPADPKVQAALTACREKLTGLFPGRTGTPTGAR